VQVGQRIAVVRTPAGAEHEVDGVLFTGRHVVERGVVDGGVALEELQVDDDVIADGVLDGLLHRELHVLLVLRSGVDRNVDVDGPLGDAVAQLFLGALGKGLGELGVVPGVVTVVQIDAFIIGNELGGVLLNDGAVGAAVGSGLEGVRNEGVADDAVGVLLAESDGLNGVRGVSGVNGAAEVGVQNGGLGVSLLGVGLAGGGNRGIVVQSVHLAIPVESAPVRGGGGHALVLVVGIELGSLRNDLGQGLVDGGGGDFAVHEHVELLGRILTVGVGHDNVLNENVLRVVVVGVGVEAHFLRRDERGQDVAAVVEDGVGFNGAEVGALGLEELGVDGPQDGVGGHAVEVAAGTGQGVGELVAVRLDADVFPLAGAIGVLAQADDEVSNEAEGLALGVNSVLQTGDEVLSRNGVVLFAGAGGPNGVVTNGEVPLGSIVVAAPLGSHAGDELAVVVLGEQAFHEVVDVVAVGGLVVVNIVQRGDVEVRDHGESVRTGVLFDRLRGRLFSRLLGRGLSRLFRRGFRGSRGRSLASARGQAQHHDNGKKQRKEFLHCLFSSLLDFQTFLLNAGSVNKLYVFPALQSSKSRAMETPSFSLMRKSVSSDTPLTSAALFASIWLTKLTLRPIASANCSCVMPRILR